VRRCFGFAWPITKVGVAGLPRSRVWRFERTKSPPSATKVKIGSLLTPKRPKIRTSDAAGWHDIGRLSVSIAPLETSDEASDHAVIFARPP
jgi:hypothetical protein